jgi:hypothetical protein
MIDSMIFWMWMMLYWVGGFSVDFSYMWLNEPKAKTPPRTPQTLVSHILGPHPPKHPPVHLALSINENRIKIQKNTDISSSIKSYYLSYIYIYTIRGESIKGLYPLDPL